MWQVKSEKTEVQAVKEKLKELMLKHITLKNGLSSSDLVHKIMGEIGPMAFTNDEFHEAYEELLDSGEIQTLTFTDSADSGRAKTILFMKSTCFLNLGVFDLKGIADGQKSTTSHVCLARASY